MKKSSYWKRKHGLGIMWLFVTLCFVGCKDDDQGEGAFDPDKPVEITDFTPKSGGYGSNLIVYGNNFGDDLFKVKVTVGGKAATVISVKNQSLYCVIPQKAYDGNVQVSILDEAGEEIAYAEANDVFDYQRQWLVTTPIGTRYEVSTDEVEKEGPFTDCGCFNNITWFSFDPKSNFDRMYMTTHSNPPNRLIDFSTERVSYFTTTGLSRPSIMNWTVDENQDMILSDSRQSDGVVNWRFSRSSNFTESRALVSDEKLASLAGAVIHPINGELYYCLYYMQDVYRYDFETQQTTSPFRHLRARENMRMVVHPSGNYMYLTQYAYNGVGRYIMRSDYDWENKTFTTPYIVCGSDSQSGYTDGVGDKARLAGPAQGVFVKNLDYEGEADEYDFYFCDESNHAIRVLTPTGRVYTYAGRGNNGTSGFADGELRTEARFNMPRAIAYDEKRHCFYVGDYGNKVIRKIAEEE